MLPELRVVIVDDEPLVRRGIARALQQDRSVTVIAECSNGLEAVATLLESRPHLVFLDVQMPELDGFGVLEALGDDRPPAVVFTTAFDTYAVRAFDAHAVDYLLKPFDDARLFEALARARVRRAGASAAAMMTAVPSAPERFAVRVGSRVRIVALEDVEWFEAADNYVALHTMTEQHLLRETLTALERRLPATRYARTHRSAIVTLARVREWKLLPSGDGQIRLSGGATVPLSRSFREAFVQRMNAVGT
jgi:two-component system, LytTR family, response regulator